MKLLILTFTIMFSGITQAEISPKHVQQAFNIAVNSKSLNNKQYNILSNLSSFFYYAERRHIQVITKRSNKVLDEVGDFSDSFDVETAYDWAINIVFMSDELTKYGMVTGIILGVFDTTDLGVEPLDILRLVATNEYLHYPYNKTLQSEDFEMALYVILSETSPENFEWKVKNDDHFRKGISKLILKVRQQ